MKKAFHQPASLTVVSPEGRELRERAGFSQAVEHQSRCRAEISCFSTPCREGWKLVRPSRPAVGCAAADGPVGKRLRAFAALTLSLGYPTAGNSGCVPPPSPTGELVQTQSRFHETPAPVPQQGSSFPVRNESQLPVPRPFKLGYAAPPGNSPGVPLSRNCV